MKPPLVRELRQALTDLGCRRRRMTPGSHEVWETPSGRAFVLVVNHLAAPVSRGVLQQVRRLLAREGIDF